jgi:archaellin
VRIRSSIFAAALIGLVALPGRASTVLFDQTPTNTNSFSITEFRLADDFTLSNQSTVTDLLFYYTYSSGGSPSDLGAVTYAIYTNNAGALGTVLELQTIASGSVTRTGQSGLCPTCASATFSITPLPSRVEPTGSNCTTVRPSPIALDSRSVGAQ